MGIHTISLLVENHSGSLSRISGLFSSRGYNISSLSVAETDDPTASRMTIVANGDEKTLEQILKHLNRLVDVIKVNDFKDTPVIERELVILRVNSTADTRGEIATLTSLYGGKVAAAGNKSLTVEYTADSDSVDGFISMLKPFGIKELVRSGKIALAKVRK